MAVQGRHSTGNAGHQHCEHRQRQPSAHGLAPAVRTTFIRIFHPETLSQMSGFPARLPASRCVALRAGRRCAISCPQHGKSAVAITIACCRYCRRWQCGASGLQMADVDEMNSLLPARTNQLALISRSNKLAHAQGQQPTQQPHQQKLRSDKGILRPTGDGAGAPQATTPKLIKAPRTTGNPTSQWEQQKQQSPPSHPRLMTHKP